jgi:hypothetical protein
MLVKNGYESKIIEVIDGNCMKGVKMSQESSRKKSEAMKKIWEERKENAKQTDSM